MVPPGTTGSRRSACIKALAPDWSKRGLGGRRFLPASLSTTFFEGFFHACFHRPVRRMRLRPMMRACARFGAWGGSPARRLLPVERGCAGPGSGPGPASASGGRHPAARTTGPQCPGPLPGRSLLEAELEEEHGAYVYEVELLTTGGVVRELELDARDGRILKDEEDD